MARPSCRKTFEAGTAASAETKNPKAKTLTIEKLPPLNVQMYSGLNSSKDSMNDKVNIDTS